MPTALARAIRARLDQLDRNPFAAARRGGLERSFVNDVLIGRKKSVRGDNIAKLAKALDWTVADMMVRMDGNPTTEIHRRRKAEGKTLRELAELTAIDIDRLERAEEGLVTLDADEYRRIAECFGVEPAALATAPAEPQAPPGEGWIDPARLTPLLIAAFEAFGLPESQARNLALALIAASDTLQGPEEPEQAKGLVRALARSLVKLFSR